MMFKSKSIISIFFIVVLLFTISCSEKNDNKYKEEINSLDQLCEIIEGEWSAKALAKGKTDIICEKGECRGRNIGLMRLKCEDKKVVGKLFVGLSSKYGKEYWDEIVIKNYDDKITFTIEHYYDQEAEDKIVWKKVFEIRALKNNRLYGDHSLDAFPKSQNRSVTRSKFVAIKNK